MTEHHNISLLITAIQDIGLTDCCEQDCIPTSLLKLNADNASRAVKMFAGVQKYMAENGTESLSGAARAELVQKLLHQGIKRPELKDELYMQLLKQSRGNTTPSNVKVISQSS